MKKDTPKEISSIITRFDDTEPLWTINEMAAYMRLKPETVRAMARRNIVPAIKVGKVWRFRPKVIKEWLKDQNQKDQD